MTFFGHVSSEKHRDMQVIKGINQSGQRQRNKRSFEQLAVYTILKAILEYYRIFIYFKIRYEQRADPKQHHQI